MLNSGGRAGEPAGEGVRWLQPQLGSGIGGLTEWRCEGGGVQQLLEPWQPHGARSGALGPPGAMAAPQTGSGGHDAGKEQEAQASWVAREVRQVYRCLSSQNPYGMLLFDAYYVNSFT